MVKRNNKKGLFLSVCAALILLLSACGSEDATAGDTASSAASEATTESTEVVAGASISDQSEDLVWAMSEDGNWIFAATDNITLSEDLTVSGTFHDKADDSKDIYRKLGLYTQDEEHNVTGEFTLTVPNIIVESPNFRIQNGTVIGDVDVQAEGFELSGSTVEGNVTFASQELLDSAKLEEGTVTGEVTVAE